jgi:preprotein translocase subunit SecD
VKRGLGISVVLVCLICFGSFFGIWAANWHPKLGLDLAGGLSVNYEPLHGQIVPASILQEEANIMTERASAAGLSNPSIEVQGNTVQVQIPGVTNYQAALNVIGNTSQLYFRPVLCAAPDYVPPTPAKGKPAPKPIYVPDSTAFTCPTANLFTSADYSSANGGGFTPPAAWTELSGFSSTLPDNDKPQYPVLIDDPQDEYGPRLLLGAAQATGTIVKTATAALNATGQWVVNVSLTGPGTSTFNALAAKDLHTPLANDLGGAVASAPIIDDTNYDTGITISGGSTGFTHAQADTLQSVLQFGTLPVQMQAQDLSFVSATLGKSSLKAGLVAGMVGLLLVMIYMVLYYRALGLVVVFGLITTGAFIYALIAILGNTLNLTLDLSGVTGLIVSVGITVDSYVVYFERLKDEIRAGRTVRASVDRGFKSAFRTVVSADLVSLLGALTLWLLTIGAVKGFAFWLGISTIIDLFTAYFFTRPLVIMLGRNPIVTDARRIGIARGLATVQEAPA